MPPGLNTKNSGNSRIRKLSDNFTIVISRADSIGDVVLTLPMAGYLKKYYPRCRIIFLGRSYTEAIVSLSEHVDAFLNFDELSSVSVKKAAATIAALKPDVFLHVFPCKKISFIALLAGIPLRAGTRNRWYHWVTCNRLLKLSRKGSDLHEAQLNLKLLGFFGLDTDIKLNELYMYYGFTKVPVLSPELFKLIAPDKVNVILHPRSKGSAREWGLDNFSALIALLSPEKYRVFITGTAEDRHSMHEFLHKNPVAIDLTGKMSLDQLTAFISHCDALVAASTGPLHIASALGLRAIGLYVPRRPMHPGRWAPVGPNAAHLVYDAACADCAAGKECDCITRISPLNVIHLLPHERLPR